MTLDGYEVIIPQGINKTDGYVEITNDTQYTVRLCNTNNVRVDAEVLIDGKHIGTFRIERYSSIDIERPVNDTGKFTFYRGGTQGFKEANLKNIDKNNLGLISVIFKPERKIIPRGGIRGQSVYNTVLTHCSYKSGGTGLSGKSNQNFVDVQELNYDQNRFVEINIRLIERDNKIRELKPVRKSTPIPKPVDNYNY